MVISRKDMSLERQYSARLTGRQIVEVRPQVSGCITRILTNEGEAVRKGQTLFVIDQVPYRAALEMAVAARKSAEARLATARMNYENESRLQEGHVVGDVSVVTMRNALQEAEAALAQARAQEVNARNNLSYTEVKSPVSGVASMIPWHVGSLVGSNISEPLVTVADDSEMYVYFSISEKMSWSRRSCRRGWHLRPRFRRGRRGRRSRPDPGPGRARFRTTPRSRDGCAPRSSPACR